MMDSGAQFVMTDGGCRKQLSPADRWTVGMHSQSNTKPTLAEVRIRFGWMILTVLAMRRLLVTAHTEVLEKMTVTTVKMLVLYAQVTLFLLLKNVIVGEVLDKMRITPQC